MEPAPPPGSAADTAAALADELADVLASTRHPRGPPWREARAAVGAAAAYLPDPRPAEGADAAVARAVGAERVARAFAAAVDFFADTRWLDAVGARMSGSFVSRVRKTQLRLRREAREFDGALQLAAREGLRAFVGERAEAAGDLAEAALALGAASPAVFDAVLGVLDRGVSAGRAARALRTLALGRPPAADAPAAPMLRLLPLGSLRAAPGAVGAPPRGCASFPAYLPRARPYVYDVGMLLRGAPGTDVSGVSYPLIRALESIRRVDRDAGSGDAGEGSAAADSGRAFREDAPGVFRELLWGDRPASAAELEKMLETPVPDLESYNRLAEDALFSAPGTRVSAVDELLDKYSLEYADLPPAEAELRAAELALRAHDDAAAAARAAASAVLRLRCEAAGDLELWVPDAALFAGSAARSRESAVTAFLQAGRVRQAVERVARRGAADARGAAPPAALRRAFEDAELSPASLKMYVAARGRAACPAAP